MDIPDIAILYHELRQLYRNIEAVLGNVGEYGKCRRCGQDVYCVTHRNGRKATYRFDGRPHALDCDVEPPPETRRY